MGRIQTEDISYGVYRFIIILFLNIYFFFVCFFCFGDDKVWKNPVTGNLHFIVHPCGAKEIIVDPLPKDGKREGALYPDGIVISGLKEVRDLLYKMQRPAISPSVSFQPFFSISFSLKKT